MNAKQKATAKARQARPRTPRGYLPAVLGAVAVFGLMIVWITLQLRADLRQQMITRDAAVLTSVSEMLANDLADDAPLLGYAGVDLAEAIGPDVGIMTAAMRGVIAVSVHDVAGGFIWGFPMDAAADPLPAEHVALAAPAVQFHEAFPLENLFLGEPGTAALLEITAPVLFPDGSMASVRYWMDGKETEAAFAALDKRLAMQAGGAWLAASALLAAFVFTFQRIVSHRQRMLEAQSRQLEETTLDLDMRSKSSALGAVTAALVHDLRGPLTVLHTAIDVYCQDLEARVPALNASRKMQHMIDEIIGVMRDQGHVQTAPYALEDIRDALGDAFDGDPRLTVKGRLREDIPAKEGGLVIVVLKQLVRNALEASYETDPVTVVAGNENGSAVFTVEDRAGGLPENLQSVLFRPKARSLKNGSGIGLTIAREISASIGAELSLLRSDDHGTCFCLNLPLKSSHDAPPENSTPPADLQPEQLEAAGGNHSTARS